MPKTLDKQIESARQRAELAELRNRVKAERIKGQMLRLSAQRLMTAGGATGYGNATRTRTRDGYHPRGGSAASHMQPYVLRGLRRSSQDLDRNNPVARALVARTADMVWGNGFPLQAMSKDTDWNKAVEAWWSRWADQVGDNTSDVTGRHTLSHIGYEAFRGGCLVEGDVGVLKTAGGQVQLIESERIGNPNGALNTDTILNGVEIEKSGKPIAYHVSEWTPIGQTFSESTARRIPARDMLLISNPMRMRTGQVRGEPAMAACIDRFEHLDQTSEAVRISFYVGACQALIVSSNTPGDDQGFAGTETTVDQNGSAAMIEDIVPGAVHHIGKDKTISGFTPTQPNQSYDTLVMSELTQIAADANLPVVLLLLDFSKTSYSSARSMTVTAFRGFRRCQKYLTDTFYTPIYRWRLAMAIRRGEIEGFEAGYVPEGWDVHQFIPPPPPVLDILVEMQAAELGIRTGIDTRQDVYMSLRGSDYDDKVDRLEFEDKDLKKRGLSFNPGAKAKETTATEKADGSEIGGGTKSDAA